MGVTRLRTKYPDYGQQFTLHSWEAVTSIVVAVYLLLVDQKVSSHVTARVLCSKLLYLTCRLATNLSRLFDTAASTEPIARGRMSMLTMCNVMYCFNKCLYYTVHVLNSSYIIHDIYIIYITVNFINCLLSVYMHLYILYI